MFSDLKLLFLRPSRRALSCGEKHFRKSQNCRSYFKVPLVINFYYVSTFVCSFCFVSCCREELSVNKLCLCSNIYKLFFMKNEIHTFGYFTDSARSVSWSFAIIINTINNEVAIQMLPLKTSRLVTYFQEIARFCI